VPILPAETSIPLKAEFHVVIVLDKYEWNMKIARKLNAFWIGGGVCECGGRERWSETQEP